MIYSSNFKQITNNNVFFDIVLENEDLSFRIIYNFSLNLNLLEKVLRLVKKNSTKSIEIYSKEKLGTATNSSIRYEHKIVYLLAHSDNSNLSYCIKSNEFINLIDDVILKCHCCKS